MWFYNTILSLRHQEPTWNTEDTSNLAPKVLISFVLVFLNFCICFCLFAWLCGCVVAWLLACLLWIFEAGFHVAQVGFTLAINLRLPLNF